eukprot:TRINITY_DN56693_c0_g1_i1.p1 TRINITY_DN56693_c0_g1~~TRINITY_DN56693_c0_g1_i1.p1  ORF type:complete len:319 (+),score=55.99 TRINITY_DN56693_c0_g1_i1:382-1338(+)
MKASGELVARLMPLLKVQSPEYRESVNTWPKLIDQAAKLQMDLDCHVYTPGLKKAPTIQYNNTSATLTEVEVDGLTGQVEILRSDLHMDMGKSMNPLVDMGQLQGAFLIGSGHALCEKMNRAEGDMHKQVDWFDYHPPTPWEGPKQWYVELEASKMNEQPGSMGNKSVGETGVVLGQTSVYSAVQQAIYEIQKENRLSMLRPSPIVPMTVNIRQGLCRAKAEQMPSIIDTCANHQMPDRNPDVKRAPFVPLPRNAPKKAQTVIRPSATVPAGLASVDHAIDSQSQKSWLQFVRASTAASTEPKAKMSKIRGCFKAQAQ